MPSGSASAATNTGESIAASLRILKGKPTAEQLAAVVAALTLAQTQAAAAAPAEHASRSRWAVPAMRGSLPHGPGAWRHSLRNR